MKFTFVNTLYRFDGMAHVTLEFCANNRDEAEAMLRGLVSRPEQWRLQE
jgi:hypothetical protein